MKQITDIWRKEIEANAALFVGQPLPFQIFRVFFVRLLRSRELIVGVKAIPDVREGDGLDRWGENIQSAR